MIELSLDDIKWAYTAVAVPVGGWVAVRWARRREKRRALRRRHERDDLARQQRIDRLAGLPPECKSILYDYYAEGAHTRRLDPGHPAVDLLVRQGILKRGPSGGTYAAIDCYMILRPDVWAALEQWLEEDPPADC